MGRRKGELTAAQIDCQWPHQVALSEENDHKARFARSVAIEEFCAGDGISHAPRGHSFVAADRWHQVYCFATRGEAELFKERFGGEFINPRERARWGTWVTPKEK